MFSKKFVQGTVIENKHWTERLYSLKVDAEIQTFLPGQFGRLGLELEGEEIARPYSFVNAPTEPYLEFYSIIVPEGHLSSCLHRLQSGAKVWVAASPSGFFTLNEIPEGRELWMLSTGTALGPFLSILKTDEPWQRFDKIVLVHAVRTEEELTYKETIAAFKATFPRPIYNDTFCQPRTDIVCIAGGVYPLRLKTALWRNEPIRHWLLRVLK